MHIKKYWLSYTLYHPTFTIASENQQSLVVVNIWMNNIFFPLEHSGLKTLYV